MLTFASAGCGDRLYHVCCRRTAQTATAGGNEKDAVKSYFNTQGFERWNRIYGTTDDVNKVPKHLATANVVTRAVIATVGHTHAWLRASATSCILMCLAL